jgi:DNA-binding Lrp family transcriptional regulator
VARPLSALEARLLNDYQAGFPLVPAPFAVIARDLRVDEAPVLAMLDRLVAEGTVSRVGAVFRPGTVGASTLAAMEVPDAELEHVAGIVSARPEVNHNYEREHRYNLWFVVTAANADARDAALAALAADTGYVPICLPLAEDFWIDLGFGLGEVLARDRGNVRGLPAPAPIAPREALSDADRLLVQALERGLPVTPRPYASIAGSAGMCESRTLERLADWLGRGVVKRLGIVVRHRALGYVANAMCVWNVPDAEAGAIGRALARETGVTLCYRRERAPGRWPYNLYCMIHGQDRAAVTARIASLSAAHGLDRFAHAVLFSRRAFKQRGAHYGLCAAGARTMAAA